MHILVMIGTALSGVAMMIFKSELHNMTAWMMQAFKSRGSSDSRLAKQNKELKLRIRELENESRKV